MKISTKHDHFINQGTINQSTINQSTINQDRINQDSYAELHCISNFSFLRGASHPDELVKQASNLGYAAIAITDECSMAGIVKAHVAAKECQIKLIAGSEFHLDEGIHLVLLAANRIAYGQICNLITLGRRRANKGEYQLSVKDLCFGMDQCLAIWLPDRSDNLSLSHKHSHSYSNINYSNINRLSSTDNAGQDKTQTGMTLKRLFKQQLWLGIEIFPDGHEMPHYQQAFHLSEALQVNMVAMGDVHMHHPDRKALQDVLAALRMGQSVRLAGKLLFANREKYLRPVSVISQFYPASLLAESLHIADLCEFSLDELRYEYPKELVPAHMNPSEYLRLLVETGAKTRWPAGIKPAVQETIEKELQLIAELSYEYYFLTVFDVVHFARNQNILCQGRGSAANSAVCFCLQITEVDPAKASLLFERFISKERDEPPDIDVDFEHERREEVIQYIYKKYGRDRAALAATVITYRPKSAVRDVGKALGMDPQLIEQLAKSLSWWDKREQLLERFTAAGVNPRSPLIGQFMALVNEILGFPRHLSQHVGGFIISQGPLSHLVPVENAAMEKRTIIQWDKNDLEALGLLKIDVLALGMLTAIRKSLDMINQYRGYTSQSKQNKNRQLTIANIPAEDPQTYQMLQAGDSVGVFQVESRAQISMLPRLKPRCFYDLVIQVAIVRPGPIQGKMVHPYLKRRNGEEAVSYANDAIKSVLGRTLGVPIFQEQVIKLAVVAAGFTPGEADQLRRAMAAWKRKGGLEIFQQKLISGMLERGHDLEFAERIFEQIKGFGDYGFPESHAASFALLVYFSAWLKCHEPAAFYCGLLNSQPMGFYSASQLVQDARRHGVEIKPVDISTSDWESILVPPSTTCSEVEARPTEPASQNILNERKNAQKDEQRINKPTTLKPQPAIRLGFQRIKGFKQTTAQRIITIRANPTSKQQPVKDLQTFAQQAQLDRGDLQRLTEAGALRSLSGHRYQTHWETKGMLTHPNGPSQNSLLTDFNTVAEKHKVYLPPPTEEDDLRADYTSTGLTLGRHPMAMLRQKAPFRKLTTATELEQLNHGRFVQVAGIVTGRQRPASATGVLFLTLEDETNNINVVVWNQVLETFRAAVVQGRLLKIKGIMERQRSVIHVIAGHVEDLSQHLEHFSLKSRDFR
ncbi:MAG: error-prone DNA polymerase [Pseudomonadales bacterium]|nr:error-prone DNA polymerase [Pseudomonadales bacterium]